MIEDDGSRHLWSRIDTNAKAVFVGVEGRWWTISHAIGGQGEAQYWGNGILCRLQFPAKPS